jgi:hypothetical protein
MTTSPVERMVDAFSDYVIASLPGKITTANVGQTIAAPALKKIEKSVRADAQYWPRAIVNADTFEFGEAGQLSRMVEIGIDVYVFASHTTPTTLAIYLERYLDSVVDLSTSTGIIPVLGYGLRVISADKGVEPDGTRGWVVVRFLVWSEAAY